MDFVDINECAGDPCENDGTCNDIINGYYCTCVNGFTGLSCETGIVIISLHLKRLLFLYIIFNDYNYLNNYSKYRYN